MACTGCAGLIRGHGHGRKIRESGTSRRCVCRRLYEPARRWNLVFSRPWESEERPISLKNVIVPNIALSRERNAERRAYSACGAPARSCETEGSNCSMLWICEPVNMWATGQLIRCIAMPKRTSEDMRFRGWRPAERSSIQVTPFEAIGQHRINLHSHGHSGQADEMFAMCECSARVHLGAAGRRARSGQFWSLT